MSGMRTRILHALSVSLLLGCGEGPLDPEYQVIRAYLGSPHAEQGPGIALYERSGIFFIFNLDQENADGITAFFAERAHRDLDPALVRDFVARNHRPRGLEKALLPEHLRYETVFMKKDVYAISRVGFGPGGDEALLYVTFSSMSEFGHGSLIHLRKRFGRWRVQDTATVWVYG